MPEFMVRMVHGRPSRITDRHHSHLQVFFKVHQLRKQHHVGHSAFVGLILDEQSREFLDQGTRYLR